MTGASNVFNQNKGDGVDSLRYSWAAVTFDTPYRIKRCYATWGEVQNTQCVRCVVFATFNTHIESNVTTA